MKRDQIIIYVLIGVMVFSAVATGLIFLAQDDTLDPTSGQNEGLADASDIINQASQFNDQIPQERFTPDGDVTELQIVDLQAGTGAEATIDSTVTVHYTGWLASDGTIFDSSHLRGEPATFGLSSVIEGWAEGIPGMKEGGKRRLIIPSEKAYGASGTPDGSIPADADLVFEVELVSVE